MLCSAIAITMPLENMIENLMTDLDMLKIAGDAHGLKQHARIVAYRFGLLRSSKIVKNHS